MFLSSLYLFFFPGIRPEEGASQKVAPLRGGSGPLVSGKIQTSGARKKGSSSKKRLRKPVSPEKILKKTLLVRVFSLEGKTRVPAPHAKVYFLDAKKIGPSGLEDLNARFGDYRFAEIEKTGLCRKFVAGSSGEVVIPLHWMKTHGWRKRRAWILAESADAKAASLAREIVMSEDGLLQTDYPGNRNTIEKSLDLILLPRTDLRVRVYDRFGKPAPGVPVGLFYALVTPTSRRGLLRKGLTGPDGHAVFHGVQKILKVFSHHSLFTSFLFPFKDLAKFSYSLEYKKGVLKPIRMVLPETGSLTVHVKNVPPTKKGAPGWVALFHTRRFSLDARTSYGWPDCRFYLLSYSQPLKASDTAIRFPFVGLGMDLMVVGIRKDLVSIALKKIRGPAVPGEKVSTSLAFPPSDPTVTLELVDSKGRPLRFMPVEIFFPWQKFHGESALRRTFKTDSLGRLEVPLPPPFPEGEWKQMKLLAHLGTKKGIEVPKLIDLPPVSPRGKRKLGKIILDVPPLLLSGKVLDFQGKPCEGAWVSLSREGIGQDGRERLFPVTGCSTDREGNFFVRQKWPWKTMMVSAFKMGEGVSPPVLVSPGARGVQLRLSGAGSMEVTFLLDDPAYLRHRMVRAIVDFDEGLPGIKCFNFSGRKRIKRGWRFIDLKPGIYTLDLVPNGQPGKILYHVSGIRIRPGEVCRDARLQDIDLRGKLDRAVVTVLDEKGRPLNMARTSIPNLSLYETKERIHIAFLKGSSPTLVLSAPGFKKKKITLQAGSYTIRMEKAK